MKRDTHNNAVFKMTPFPDKKENDNGVESQIKMLQDLVQELSTQVKNLTDAHTNSVICQDNMLFTIDQVALIMSPVRGGKPVSTATVRRWINSGLLLPVPETHYRISGHEIKRFLKERYSAR